MRNKEVYEHKLSDCFLTRDLAMYAMSIRLKDTVESIVRKYKITSEMLTNPREDDVHLEELVYYISRCVYDTSYMYEVAAIHIIDHLVPEFFSDLQRRYVREVKRSFDKLLRRAPKIGLMDRSGNDKRQDILFASLCGDIPLTGFMASAVGCALGVSVDMLSTYCKVNIDVTKYWNNSVEDICNNIEYQLLKAYVNKFFDNKGEITRLYRDYYGLGYGAKSIAYSTSDSDEYIKKLVKMHRSVKCEGELEDAGFVVDPMWLDKTVKNLANKRAKKIYNRINELNLNENGYYNLKEFRHNFDIGEKCGTLARDLEGCLDMLVMFADETTSKVVSEENNKLKYEVEHVKKDVQRKVSKIDALKNEVEKLRSSNNKLSCENTKLKKEKSSCGKSAIDSYKNEIESLNKRIFNLERELGIAQKDKDSLEIKNRELERESSDLKVQCEVYEEEMSELRNENVTHEFNIDDNIGEIRKLIGNRRVFVVGSTNKWRELISGYFNSTIGRSVDSMSVDEIKSNDLVLLSIKQMKHCISVPVLQKCRQLGVKCIMLNESNLQHVMHKVHTELRAEAGLGQGWFYGKESI